MNIKNTLLISLSLWIIPFLLSCSTQNLRTKQIEQTIEDDLEKFIYQAQQSYHLPAGLAVAVYTPNGVYAQGFGVTDIDTGAPVTADTAFYIASSTKSFLAMALNKLHHGREIDLNASLAEYAPKAPFPDSIHPNEVTLRQLLTHTSGISNDAIAFRSAYSGEHTPDLLWQLLATSRVNEEAPHDKFQYTNTGYNILSILTDKQYGAAWQDLIAREIIEPAGMRRTTAYMSQANQNAWSVARPHAPDMDGTLRRLALEKVDATMQSAGGMVMSANDALLWLELLITDGQINGKQILPVDVVTETRQRLATVDRKFGLYHREDYGLGWYINTYKGDLMVHHFGGFSAFRAHVSYLPERGVGIAVFSNTAPIGSIYVDAIANYAYDLLAGRRYSQQEQQDLINSLQQRYQSALEAVAQDRAIRSSRQWQLGLPLASYVGVYKNPLLGTLSIAMDSDRLIARLGVMHAKLEPYTNPESARVELIPLRGLPLQFTLEEDTVTAVEVFDGRFERVQ